MNVACVICHKPFDQTAVDHLPDRAAAQRWTCSRVCQKRLEKRGEQRAEEAAVVQAEKVADFGEPAGPSKAEDARQALGRLGVRPVGRPGAISAVTAAGEPEAPVEASTGLGYARAARHLLAAAEELDDPEDRLVILTIAGGFVDRTIAGHEAHLGIELGAVAEGGLVLSVPSESQPGVSYEVRVSSDGAVSCTCEAGQHGRPCKHVQRVRVQR